MSYKATNGKLIRCDSKNWKSNSLTASILSSTESSVKLAGEEAKDRLYEPKHKKKLVRVLTVVAYLFLVSLAAIMLSLYYILLWNGDQKAKEIGYQQSRLLEKNKCDKIVAEIQRELDLLRLRTKTLSLLPPDPTTTPLESTTWFEDTESIEEEKGLQEVQVGPKSVFFQKLTDNNNSEYFFKNDT